MGPWVERNGHLVSFCCGWVSQWLLIYYIHFEDRGVSWSCLRARTKDSDDFDQRGNTITIDFDEYKVCLNHTQWLFVLEMGIEKLNSRISAVRVYVPEYFWSPVLSKVFKRVKGLKKPEIKHWLITSINFDVFLSCKVPVFLSFLCRTGLWFQIYNRFYSKNEVN